GVRLGLGVYVVAQATLLCWWAACYPGVASPDTATYVWQVTTSNWKTDHSVAYCALVWLSLRLVHGLSLLALAQTVAAALGFSYVATGLRRLGVPGWLAAVPACLVALLPTVGVQVVYVS